MNTDVENEYRAWQKKKLFKNRKQRHKICVWSEYEAVCQPNSSVGEAKMKQAKRSYDSSCGDVYR